MTGDSSARYHELWRALHSVQELTKDVVIYPDHLEAGAASPDRGFRVAFEDPDLRRRVTYIIEPDAVEVQIYDRESGQTVFHPIDLDLTNGYRVFGEERSSAVRAAAELLKDAVERTRAEADE